MARLRRTWAVSGLVLVGVGVATGLSWLSDELQRADAAARTARPAAIRASALPTAAPVQTASAVSSTGRAWPPMQTGEWPATGATRMPVAGEVAVCGDAPMRADRLQGLDLGAPWVGEMAPALQSIATALAGGDALAQGAALMVERMADLPTALSPAALQARLVDLALSSGDPDVWMLARKACQADPAFGSAACERLTAQAWMRTDPGNAAPWLWIMAEAVASHQDQAADEALYRASQSRFHDARISGLGRVLAHPALDPRRGLPAHLAAISLVGLQAAYALPSYASLMRRCDVPRLADANRRLVCDDLAHLLVERSRGAIDISIGFRLGERLGWDSVQLRAADDLRLALQSAALVPAAAVDPAGVLSCAALDELRDRLVTQAQTGERAYLTGRLEALGLSTAGEAQKLRVRRATAAASAAQSTPR